MGHGRTNDINDYLDDYERSAEDYATMGDMWSELVFPDDFEALRAIQGGKQEQQEIDDDTKQPRP